MPGPDGGAGLRWGVEPMCAVLSRARCADQPVDLLRVDHQDARHVGRCVTPNWWRSSPPSAKTRRPASSCRPWARARCGSGCAARATTLPAARWSGSCANRGGRGRVTGPSTRPPSLTTATSRYPDLVDRTLLRASAKSVVGGRLYLCVDLDGVRLRRVRHRCVQPPDRGLACRQVDDHRAGPRRHRACLLHPRPGRQCQPARADRPQRCGQPIHLCGVHPTTHRRRSGPLGRLRRRCAGQRLGRDHRRVVQERTHPSARPLARRQPGRARHRRMGAVVQHRTPARYLDDFTPEAVEKLHYDHRRTPPKAG